jgi:hypothetical protein
LTRIQTHPRIRRIEALVDEKFGVQGKGQCGDGEEKRETALFHHALRIAQRPAAPKRDLAEGLDVS